MIIYFFIAMARNFQLGEGSRTGSTISLPCGSWKIGKILASKFRDQDDYNEAGETRELQQVYEAVRDDKTPGILKVKEQWVSPLHWRLKEKRSCGGKLTLTGLSLGVGVPTISNAVMKSTGRFTISKF
jgi:hypothetical protein